MDEPAPVPAATRPAVPSMIVHVHPTAPRGDVMNGYYRSAEGARAVERRYRALLDRWPVPNEHLRVPTREGETFVVACGPVDAPPLLLLHGSSTNAAMWINEAPAWSPHFRMYAVDVIGEPGLS